VYLVFAEEIETDADISRRAVETLEQAFAQIVCRCGFNYHFEHGAEGWALVLRTQNSSSCCVAFRSEFFGLTGLRRAAPASGDLAAAQSVGDCPQHPPVVGN
jgi:hypothetical protein